MTEKFKEAGDKELAFTLQMVHKGLKELMGGTRKGVAKKLRHI